MKPSETEEQASASGAAEKAEFIQKCKYSFQLQVGCFQLTVKVLLHLREAIRTSKTQGVRGIFKASILTVLSLRRAPQANAIQLEMIVFKTQNHQDSAVLRVNNIEIKIRRL